MRSHTPMFVTLRVEVSGAIAKVIFEHPPINLMDVAMFDDLDRLGAWLTGQTGLKVAVFESSVAGFFIAHADLRMLEDLPGTVGPKPQSPSPHQKIVDRFRTLPQATIAKIDGVARGGGSEFLLALDMRFGSIGRAVFGQPEVALGFPPGCGATQRLPRLVGRSNALEIILGCGDYSAEDAARIGWLNRAMPPEDLDGFVSRLAERIASFPAKGIVASKAAIAAATLPLQDGLCDELQSFLIAFASEEVKARLKRALDRGFQTAHLESQMLDSWLGSLAND